MVTASLAECVDIYISRINEQAVLSRFVVIPNPRYV
jgi:hypothetical protein